MEIFQIQDQTSPPQNLKVNIGKHVKLQIKYEKSARERILPKDLEQLGKALCRGTFKEISNVAFKHTNIKKEIMKLFLKSIAKESEEMCSRKNPSILRKTKREDIVNFSFDSFVDELKVKAPVLCGALMVATVKNTHNQKSNIWIPSITVDASVLLKNRCLHMNAFQILMNTIMHHSSQTLSIYLCCVDLKYIYKKTWNNIKPSGHKDVRKTSISDEGTSDKGV